MWVCFLLEEPPTSLDVPTLFRDLSLQNGQTRGKQVGERWVKRLGNQTLEQGQVSLVS